MEKYLLSILGSSTDYFYQADSYPTEGEFTHVRFLGSYPGTCPLNVAAIAASKGIEVKCLDMLGKEDDTTPFLLGSMKKLNIDTSHIEIKEGVINAKVTIYLTGDKRTMFIVDPERPPYEVDPRMQELLNRATYIYSLMHMIKRSFTSLDPLLEAKKHGAKIVLDGSSKYDDPSRVKILYELADGLFINRSDYQRLSDHSPKDPKEIILENGGEFVAVTDGDKGSVLYLKDRTISKPAVKGLEVIDSTGAGDSFAASFIASLIKGYSYDLALSYANLGGAYACTVFSGMGGIASFDTLERFGKEHGYEL